MIYAGIDISKYKHDCFILSDFGEVVNDGFSFTNTAKGFAQLTIFFAASREVGFQWTSSSS